MSKDIYQSIDETEEILCEEYHPHESSIQAAIQEMPSDDELFDLAETFKIFGDSTRIRIICALLPGEMCVCDLSDLLGDLPISHQPPAAAAAGQPSGKKPAGGQIHLLFSG